jgi:opacity protein-like surface antigen
MRKAHLCLLMLLTTVGFVSNAEAKNRDKSWEFGAMYQHIDADRGSGVKNSYGEELRFGYNFSSKVEAELLYGVTSTDHLENDDDFVRILAIITANLFTDRDTKTVPYISAGLGVIQETRSAFTDPNGMRVFESFDSSAILTLGAGARTFFNDNWGVRYEARYNHHDSFTLGQDEYLLAVGVTWVVGGKK